MRRKVTIALAVLSGVLLLIGVINFIALALELSPDYAGGYSVDGTDFSGLMSVFGLFTLLSLSFTVVSFYLCVIGVIWAVYGAVLLVMRAVRRRRQKKLPDVSSKP